MVSYCSDTMTMIYIMKCAKQESLQDSSATQYHKVDYKSETEKIMKEETKRGHVGCLKLWICEIIKPGLASWSSDVLVIASAFNQLYCVKYLCDVLTFDAPGSWKPRYRYMTLESRFAADVVRVAYSYNHVEVLSIFFDYQLPAKAKTINRWLRNQETPNSCPKTYRFMMKKQEQKYGVNI